MEQHQLIVRKLSVFILGGLLLVSAAVRAQEQQTSTESNLKAKFGIKGGLNLTNLYVADVSHESMKAGFNGGVFAKLPLTKGFSIQPELLYSLKGAKENYNNFVQGSGEYRFNLSYLELPVLSDLNLPPKFILHLARGTSYLLNLNLNNVKSHAADAVGTVLE